MKTFLITNLIICIVVFQNVSAQVVGYEKYNNKTFTLVDFLNRDKIPKVLKIYYYDNLSDQDFYSPQIIISKSDHTRKICLKSKPAQKGYLYINKYSNDFITKNGNIMYLIGTDTINSKDEIIRLINMKRSEVKNVDTIKGKDYNLIKIN